ncbi:MAG TPA: efflux RND transporter periplasmic adaptor subunit [Burkholderiaceae bacterium]|nr:efflux RND transporter periplasmic adaptor subunit [Burkholderiaceae bacterium]
MKRKTVLVYACATAIVIGGFAAWRFLPAQVEVANPTRGVAIDAVYATGVVEPTVMMPVAPRTGGRLVSIETDEGAKVRRGEVMARLESADLEHTVQEMRAHEDLARSNFERTRDLVAQKFVSPAELDRARSELAAAEAASKRALAQRDYNQLVAPADGTVLRRDGEIGQYIAPGQAVFTLECCAPLRVAAEVDEEDIARVAVGQAVAMRSDAMPGRVFDGTVAQITPKGDPVARSYRVRIQFRDADEMAKLGLRTGMTMDANIVVARRENALLISSRALHGDSVWVVVDGTLRKRAIKHGAGTGDQTEVLSGLAETDAVVLSPVEGLREGQRARLAAAAH